jgi:2-oxoisovalerate dehydrogenase E1 component
MDAVHDALSDALEHDEGVYLAGIDVGAGGKVFGVTRGLKDRGPDRVLDTPISETAIVGLAVGGAMAGMLPVVEIMYLDFIGVCFDQLLNQAAKLPFITGARAQMGPTVRTQFGSGRSSGSQHSQSLEVLLAHVPGLKVVMPSTPANTYGLLRASINDPNPVIFIEHRLLYGLKGPKPPADHRVPFGRARIIREGRDATIVSYSRMVHEALAAAHEPSREGVDTEVIDLRTVTPIDCEAVYESVEKTSRLVIAHEAVMGHGVGAEIAAAVAYQRFWSLNAPIKRVGARPTPTPYSPELERVWLPDRQSIVTGVRETMSA